MNDEKEIAKAFGGNTPATFNPQELMASTAALPKSSDKPYLTFKDGEWTFGQDMAECEPKILWAINPHSFKFGLIEWFGGTAGAELLVPAGTKYSANDMVLQFDPESEDHDGKHPSIVPQVAVEMYCVTGDDEGVQVCYKASTRGGVDALNGLAQAIAKQGAANPKELVAIITLESSSYMHKKYKRKTYVPILKLQGFDNFEFDKTLKKTKKKAGKKAQPAAQEAEPETATDDSAPPPARRRRAS